MSRGSFFRILRSLKAYVPGGLLFLRAGVGQWRAGFWMGRGQQLPASGHCLTVRPLDGDGSGCKGV